MNKLFGLLALAVSSSLFALACSCTQAGCDIGSDEGVRVVVTNAAITYAGDVPLTLRLCAGATCADFTVEEKDGKLVCDDHQTDSEPDDRACGVLNGQDVQLILGVEMPDDTSDIHLTIKDGSGTQLFDDSQVVNVDAYEPNGERCGPSCRTSEVTFSPDAASQ